MGAARRGLGLGAALLLGTGLVGFSLWNRFSPACTRDVVESRTALERSSRALSLATDGGPDALCEADHRHVTALEGAARVALRCGAAQMTRRSGWSSLDPETAFYRQLAEERCS